MLERIAERLGYAKKKAPQPAPRNVAEAQNAKSLAKMKQHPLGHGEFTPVISPAGVARIRNLDPIEQDYVLNVVHYMYKFNPLASRAIAITAEYIVGDGIQFKAMNKGVQRVLDRHWDNPTNKWATLQYDRARELGLAGELIIPVWVNPENGAVVLGNIDPILVESIVPDVENSMKIHAIIIKKTTPRYFPEYHRAEYVAYKVVNVNDDIEAASQHYGKRLGLAPDEETAIEWGVDIWRGKQDSIKVPVQTNSLSGAQMAGTDGFIGQGLRSLTVTWEGACFFTKINAPMGSTRGWSDLLPNLIWLDANDQLLFALVQKAINASRYLVDVLLENMNEQQQQEWLAKNYVEFTSGEWFTHNQNVTLSFPSPDLKMDDSTTLSSALKNHILAGVGHPPIWYSESAASRASAPEMTEPSFKHIKVRQREYGYMIGEIFRFAVDQSLIAGYLSKDEAKGAAFYIKMPDVSAKDQRMLAISIANIANAVVALVEKAGWDKQKAYDFFERYLEMTGLDIGKQEPRSEDPNSTPEMQLDKMLNRMLQDSEGIAERLRYGSEGAPETINEAIDRTDYQREITYGGSTYYLYGDVEEAQKIVRERVK